MFDDLIETASPPAGSRRRILLISGILHAGFIVAAVVAPLIFYESLPASLPPVFLSYVVKEIPPPLPPPPPSPSAGSPEQVLTEFRPDEFQAPSEIPPALPAPNDLSEWPLVDLNEMGNLVGASPGSGMPGGQGSLSGWGINRLPVEPPPPPPARPTEPLTVSQGVIASRLIHRVDPIYPPMAVAARVEGIVLLQILVDRAGNVQEVQVVDGSALLAAAAVEAVKQWRYSPTLLNGEPVPVKATITVRFTFRR